MESSLTLKVEYPGRVVGDVETGKPIELHNLTIAEYFKSIGISHLYSPTDPSHNWRQMQATVTNYLGFVGFQFQESDLQDLGYYKFETTIIDNKVYPKHYVDVPVSHWKNGITGFLNTNPKEVNTPTWVTDTVRFVDANFTGKSKIISRTNMRGYYMDLPTEVSRCPIISGQM